MKKPLVADVYKLHGSAVMSIPADSPLEDAIGSLVRNPSLRGIFLVDSSQKFVGMVTIVDLIKWAHLNLAGSKGRSRTPISEFFRIVDARKAKDLVGGNRRGLSVREGDNLQVALAKMLDYEEDVIPVLDDDGKVLGDLRLSEALLWMLSYGKQTSSE